MDYLKADTNWMKGNFGFSFHWTSQSVCIDGTHLPYEEGVNRFDVRRFADTLESAGAKHCILTLTHAEQYLAMPHPLLDKLFPGHTTKRDLIGEIIQALTDRNIRFIAYYNHSCNGNDNVDWSKASGYADGIHGDLDRFAENICGIVSYIAKRYGKGISGWWFDSSYSVDPRGPVNTVSCEMGDWQFPWLKLNQAAKSGNQECAVTFNAGVGRRFLYAECQDYYAGETVELDQVFEPATVEMQDHRWMSVDSANWVMGKKDFLPLRFPAEKLLAFRDEHCAAGRMVTFNILIDQLGNINPVIRELK